MTRGAESEGLMGHSFPWRYAYGGYSTIDSKVGHKPHGDGKTGHSKFSIHSPKVIQRENGSKLAIRHSSFAIQQMVHFVIHSSAIEIVP